MKNRLRVLFLRDPSQKTLRNGGKDGKINLILDFSINRFVLQASQIVNRIAGSEIRPAFLQLRLQNGGKNV